MPAHPENKRARQLIGRRKGARRVRGFMPSAACRAHFYRDTTTPCSCWMCGNRRRHEKGREKLTRQERQQDLR